MEERSRGLPPPYECTVAQQDPGFNNICTSDVSVDNSGLLPPQSQYGYPAPFYGNTVIVQQPVTTYNQVTVVPDHMTMAVLSVFCCLPLGVAAIVNASNARTAVARQDIPAAIAKAKCAQIFSILAITIGIVLIFILILMFCVLLF